MDEKTFFQHDDVSVSNSRFIVASQTFAMSNITSVKASKDVPSRLGPIAFGMIGLIAATQNVGFGIFLIAIGVVWWFLQKTRYHVLLTTAGGETKALTTPQKEYIEKVVQALNDAIVARG